MNDLDLNLEWVRTWFPHEQDAPYVLVRVSDDHAQGLSDALGDAVRRCYITDSLLVAGSATPNVSQREIIAAKLPDPGATMAGDFGEILVYLYQGTGEHPITPIGATKWRLKQDRTKPAPYSDVVHFVLPAWPNSSAEDAILCAEVKTKSTASAFRPIRAAIEDSLKDRTSRLAKTLVWLRERALTEDLGDVQIEHLDRFLKATDHPAARKRCGRDVSRALRCGRDVSRACGSGAYGGTGRGTYYVHGCGDLRPTVAGGLHLSLCSGPRSHGCGRSGDCRLGVT